jgi:hypothetical protein
MILIRISADRFTLNGLVYVKINPSNPELLVDLIIYRNDGLSYVLLCASEVSFSTWWSIIFSILLM